MGSVKFRYDIGDKLTDKVTGFTGIVMVRAQYSTGCIHYGLASESLKSDGEMREWNWIDSSRLQMNNKSKITFIIDEERPSGAFPSGPGK